MYREWLRKLETLEKKDKNSFNFFLLRLSRFINNQKHLKLFVKKNNVLVAF